MREALRFILLEALANLGLQSPFDITAFPSFMAMKIELRRD